MTDSLARTELVVRTIAQTAVDNETYFGELDSVAASERDPIVGEQIRPV